MRRRDFDRWWWRIGPWGRFALAMTAILVIGLTAAFVLVRIAEGAPLCAPAAEEPPAIFMQAIRLTESGGEPDPHTARGDGGEAWGAYQVSLRFATDCLRAAGIPIRWPLSYRDRVRVITHLLDIETGHEWAKRRAALCLAENPPVYDARSGKWLHFWSRAYRCYRGRSGKNLTRHERRFADHMRALARRANELEER